jgi:preprotein translocase subunit SecG
VEIAVRIVHTVATIGLIVLVILQPGKSAGLSLFGGSEGTVRRKKKGREEFYAKLTVYFAVAFLVCCVALTFMRQG